MATVGTENELECGKGALACQKMGNYPNNDQFFCHAHYNGMVHIGHEHTLTPLGYSFIGKQTRAVSTCQNNLVIKHIRHDTRPA